MDFIFEKRMQTINELNRFVLEYKNSKQLIFSKIVLVELKKHCNELLLNNLSLSDSQKNIVSDLLTSHNNFN